MNNERILSFNRSKKLSIEELEGISAAGMTSYMTGNGSYGSPGGMDGAIDVTIDL